MFSVVFTMLLACTSESKDSGFIDLYNPNIDTGSPNQPSSEPDNPNQPSNEPDNPNQPSNEPGNPNQPANEPGDSNQPSNEPDGGGDTGDSGDPNIDDDGDGLAENQGDCDDGNGQIFPGATDFPGDGIDQDCSGSDATLVDVGLLNGQFDDETDGLPSDWLNIGGAFAWQADNSNIVNDDGDTGVLFNGHSPGGGALKIWGDYGANTMSYGESVVYQEFVSDANWSPANKIFWLDAWSFISDQDPLLGTAEAYVMIRCFGNNYSMEGEQMSQILDLNSQQNSWRKISTWVECTGGATLVQAVLVFKQHNQNTDHGVVYFDDVTFTEVQ